MLDLAGAVLKRQQYGLKCWTLMRLDGGVEIGEAFLDVFQILSFGANLCVGFLCDLLAEFALVALGFFESFFYNLCLLFFWDVSHYLQSYIDRQIALFERCLYRLATTSDS